LAGENVDRTAPFGDPDDPDAVAGARPRAGCNEDQPATGEVEGRHRGRVTGERPGQVAHDLPSPPERPADRLRPEPPGHPGGDVVPGELLRSALESLRPGDSACDQEGNG